MKNSKKLTENTFDRIDNYNNKENKRLKYIYFIITVTAFLIIFIIGLIIIPSNDNNGIQIKVLEIQQTDNGTINDMIGFVVYNGKIYTQAEYLHVDKEAKKEFIGQYLGTANGTFSKDTTDFSSNIIGDVYTVNGYDKNFRICIPNMYDDAEFVAFFENLNGITLTKGEDLYGTNRLKLKDNFYDIVYQLHNDWDYDKEDYKHYNYVTNEAISNFIEELYKLPFVDLTEQKPDIYHMNIKQAHLYFKMNDGTTVKLRLFENGYIGYEEMSARVFVKMDTNIFKKIFNESIK